MKESCECEVATHIGPESGGAAREGVDRPPFAARSGTVRPLAAGGAAWLRDGSCMSREAHVQF